MSELRQYRTRHMFPVRVLVSLWPCDESPEFNYPGMYPGLWQNERLE